VLEFSLQIQILTFCVFLWPSFQVSHRIWCKHHVTSSTPQLWSCIQKTMVTHNCYKSVTSFQLGTVRNMSTSVIHCLSSVLLMYSKVSLGILWSALVYQVVWLEVYACLMSWLFDFSRVDWTVLTSYIFLKLRRYTNHNLFLSSVEHTIHVLIICFCPKVK
jgi:hypothetical protein